VSRRGGSPDDSFASMHVLLMKSTKEGDSASVRDLFH